MRLVRCYDCNGHRGDWTLGGIQTGSDGGGRGEVGDRTPEERGPPRYGLAFLVASGVARDYPVLGPGFGFRDLA